jgi:hypothetical protein
MAFGNSILGALRVVLGADTAAFEEGLDRANKTLGGFAIDAAKFGKIIGASMVAAATGFGFAIKKTIDDADKMGEIAEKIGIPVQDLSRLRHAAEMSGVAFEGLQSAMGKFSRSMAEAAGNIDSQVGQAFDAIGVSATDAAGRLRPTTAVIADIAERFKGMEDGAGKTALAIQLFGRSGAELIPMLNRGRDGITGLMREADELGITLDKHTAEAANQFNDTLDRIGKLLSGMLTKAMAMLLPHLQGLADLMFESAKQGGLLSTSLSALDVVMKTLISTGTIVKAVFETIGRVIAAVASSLVQFVTLDFAGIAETFKTQLAGIKDAAVAAGVSLDQTWNGWAATISRAADETKKVAAPIIDTTNSLTESLRALRVQQTAAMEAILNAPTETFTAKMAAAEAAVRNGTITFAKFGATVKKIQDENVQQMHDMASATSSALTTIFGKSKVAAIASAVINTAQGITKNLAQYPQPIAGIMAAITAASGAAQIAAIKSTNMGGGGGSAPSASAGGGGQPTGAGSSGQTLTVDGLTPDSIMSGFSMRSLAERMLQFQRDGGEVLLRGA